MPTAPSFDSTFIESLEQLFRWRRDVRRFRATPLPDDVLEAIVDSASWAPSVGLSQPWRIVMVRDPARRAAVRTNFCESNRDALRTYHGERARRYATLKLAGLDEAPVHLAVLADEATMVGHQLGQRTMPETLHYSAVLAVHTMWLAARARNVGLGWVSILDPATITDVLQLPRTWRLIAYLCVGYPHSEDVVPALERFEWERRRPLEVVMR